MCHSTVRRSTHQLHQDVGEAGFIQLRQAPHHLADLRADAWNALRSLALPRLLSTLLSMSPVHSSHKSSAGSGAFAASHLPAGEVLGDGRAARGLVRRHAVQCRAARRRRFPVCAGRRHCLQERGHKRLQCPKSIVCTHRRGCCWHGFHTSVWTNITCLEGGVEPSVAVGGGDDGGELFPRSRIVQARVLQVVRHALEAL